MQPDHNAANPPHSNWVQRFSQPLFGPDATSGELAIGWGAAFVGGTLQLAWALTQSNWAWWQTVIATLFALDICGGVVVNVTRTGARYWHRPGQTSTKHMLFLAAHIYPFVIAWLWPDYAWPQAIALYASILIMGGIVMATPDYLKRPAAFGLGALGIVASITLLRMPVGLSWLPPLYYVKLIMAYAAGEGA